MAPLPMTRRAGLATLLLAGLLSSTGAFAQERGVTIVLPEEPDIVDPCHGSRSNIGRIVKQNVSETLTEINPQDGSVLPRLATSWERIDDRTWRFKLKEGVKYHDGTPFTAEAAAKSINRTLSPNLDCEIRVKFFGGIKVTPTAIDATTLEIKTDQPAPIMPTMMGTMTIQHPDTPADKLTREPVGTGPYVFTSWRPGQDVVLTRFDGYWGAKPQVEKATYIWRTESAVRAAMVATGEADIAPSIAVQDATDPKMDFSYFDSETTNYRIDVALPPLNDVRVRRALNLAIDREALRGSILSPDVVAATQFVVPSINGHNPNLKPWPFDPDKAKALLAEAKAAGTPVDKEITIYVRRGNYAGVIEANEAILAMLQDVGFNVKLQIVEVAEWVDLYTRPFAEDRPALEVVLEAIPTTLKLAAVTMLLAVGGAIVIGSLAAYRPGGLFDRVASIGSLAAASAPDFWVAISAILLFSVTLGWLPTSGMGGPLYWIMPIGVLVIRPFGILVQVVRNAMLGALSAPYVKTARAKGIGERAIIFVHALRNAMLPVITVAGDQAAGIVNGAVIVESIFGWPGVGKLMIDSIIQRDFAIIQASIFVTATLIFIMNIAIDLAYAKLDPRVRQG